MDALCAQSHGLRAELVCANNVKSACALAPLARQSAFVAPAGEIVALGAHDPAFRVYLVYNCVSGHAVALVALGERRLKALLVDGAVQGHGYGTNIVAALVQPATELTLCVHARNYSARRLYMRAGFEQSSLSSDTGVIEMVWTGAVWPPRLSPPPPPCKPSAPFSVVHVTGPSGAGKSELGERVRTLLPQVKVLDLDELINALRGAVKREQDNPGIETDAMHIFHGTIHCTLESARTEGFRAMLIFCLPPPGVSYSLANYTHGAPPWVLSVPRATLAERYYGRAAHLLLDDSHYVADMLADTHELLSMRELDAHVAEFERMLPPDAPRVTADEAFEKLRDMCQRTEGVSIDLV